jgi:hypothetical protein
MEPVETERLSGVAPLVCHTRTGLGMPSLLGRAALKRVDGEGVMGRAPPPLEAPPSPGVGMGTPLPSPCGVSIPGERPAVHMDSRRSENGKKKE